MKQATPPRAYSHFFNATPATPASHRDAGVAGDATRELATGYMEEGAAIFEW